ncbi:oxygenase MpaB family protein [Mycobacteroides saopaulense]|uniref:oxygenase MpaB family protein n=1 Tax=Mycobacteroides saopaulense TaxID=1578165 RepID=UPI00071FE4BC|nr:oxygenase MpaB family protein [Mycobacteroides saopaulense]ALR10660.1 hypothetical protein MYCSP_03350 [Mycobacteroides saopaulense]
MADGEGDSLTAGCPVTHGSDRSVVTPLGPESLTWKLTADWSGMLMGSYATAMQNMHPKLGAAVEDHSTFLRERWERLLRSLYPITGVVFDGERAPMTGAEVRGYHVGIKGVDSQGRRYSALDPDVFYWAHATFFKSLLLSVERFGAGLTEAQKRQLFDEHIVWYRMYGMSMRPVPRTWEEFQEYWDHMCADVLEDNKATRDLLDFAQLPKPPFLPMMPNWMWRLSLPVFTRFSEWVMVGMFDEPVRKRLGYTWTHRDERRLEWLGRANRAIFGLVPFRWRKHPRARAGWDRATGRVPVDAPLPQTSARYLPLAELRDSPHHYSPKVT